MKKALIAATILVACTVVPTFMTGPAQAQQAAEQVKEVEAQAEQIPGASHSSWIQIDFSRASVEWGHRVQMSILRAIPLALAPLPLAPCTVSSAIPLLILQVIPTNLPAKLLEPARDP